MKKILAIDDSRINLDLLAQIVRKFFPDFVFLRAESGEEGIESAIREIPDLILLDIMMPGLNGYETCKILKKGETTSQIPIIMVSALGQESAERTKGLNAGADSFISKPFDQAELKAQINVALRIKKVEDLLRSRNEKLEFDIKSQTQKQMLYEERLIQISEHVREFYWEIDNRDIITYVSPVIEQTLKVSPNDIIGKVKLSDLLLRGNNSNPVLFAPDRFNDVEIEIEIDNEKRWFSISGFALKDDNGELRGKRGVCYDITPRKQAELALKENLVRIENYQVKLKKLNSEITLIEERERRRIAENLHDSLGQTLSLAFMNLSAIQATNCPPQVKKTIESTSQLLNKAIEESRTLTYDLSPPILYELGLVPAIKWKLEQFEKKQGIKTLLNIDDKGKIFPKEINIFLYRIVGELLTNIIKHARATKVTVNVLADDKRYRISVEDDGVGFDENKTIKANTRGGFGLMSITERVESLNGTFTIGSVKKGTKAEVVLPLNASGQNSSGI